MNEGRQARTYVRTKINAFRRASVKRI